MRDMVMMDLKPSDMFNRRFDSITPSGMLQSFIGVVTPLSVKANLISRRVFMGGRLKLHC